MPPIEQMRRLLVETKFSRVVVYQQTLDDVVGIAHVQDLLQIPESDAKHRTVRELARPALFVPETKLGSDLLREMRRRNQPMAIAVDEHGLVAGVVTVEDLVEEIVGEMGKQDDSRGSRYRARKRWQRGAAWQRFGSEAAGAIRD